MTIMLLRQKKACCEGFLLLLLVWCACNNFVGASGVAQARAPKGGWWPLLGCTAPVFFLVAAAIALWAFSAANRRRPKAPAGGKGTRVSFPTLRLELFVVFAFLRVSPTSAGVPTPVPTLDPTTGEDYVPCLHSCTCQSACLPPNLYLTRPLSRRCFASPGNMKSTTSLMGVLIVPGPLAHRMRTKSP